MQRETVQKLIEAHEDRRYLRYLDSEGIPTIGVGLNLTKPGAQTRIEALGLNYGQVCEGTCSLNDLHVNSLFEIDLNDAVTDAAQIVPNFWELPDDVQHAVIDMCFNLGGPRFAKFTKFIDALEARDFPRAAREMLDSKWARQVPRRAHEDANLVAAHRG
jgi:lysozyme